MKQVFLHFKNCYLCNLVSYVEAWTHAEEYTIPAIRRLDNITADYIAAMGRKI